MSVRRILSSRTPPPLTFPKPSVQWVLGVVEYVAMRRALDSLFTRARVNTRCCDANTRAPLAWERTQSQWVVRGRRCNVGMYTTPHIDQTLVATTSSSTTAPSHHDSQHTSNLFLCTKQ